jgi:hypothetical protein
MLLEERQTHLRSQFMTTRSLLMWGGGGGGEKPPVDLKKKLKVK